MPKVKLSPWLNINEFVNSAGERIAEIDIDGYIGFSFWGEEGKKQNSKERIKAELKALADLKADTIVVNINSPGGDVAHGLSIHDLLAESKAKVITKVNGLSASAATIIAQAGNERKMSDNSLYLIHQAATIVAGNVNDISSVVDDLKKIDERIQAVYVKRSGKKPEDIKDLMGAANGNGKWLSADEAKEAGLVDEVFEPMKATAVALPAENYFNLPPLPEGYEPSQKTLFKTLKDYFTNKNSNIKEEDEAMNETQFKELMVAQGKMIEGLTALSTAVGEIKNIAPAPTPAPAPAPAQAPAPAPAQAAAPAAPAAAAPVDAIAEIKSSIAALTEIINKALVTPKGTPLPAGTGKVDDQEVF